MIYDKIQKVRLGNTLHSLFLTPFTLNRSGILIRVKSTVPVSVRLLRVEQKELTPQVRPRQEVRSGIRSLHSF